MNECWLASKRLLGDISAFVEKHSLIDLNNMSEEVVEQVKIEFISQPDFHPVKCFKVMRGLEVLCRWCIAVVNYVETKKKSDKGNRRASEDDEPVETAVSEQPITIDMAPSNHYFDVLKKIKKIELE
jgi:hypothetical protein